MRKKSKGNVSNSFPGYDLISWYHKNGRDLPWRETSDPYHIWVSEIMLQQTRVDTVIPYYHRFISAFPTIKDLAEADRQSVLKLWEGLGYYSRARNLQDAARQVMNDFSGVIPDTYDEIKQLKGVGPYTAAAILSIAFNKPYAVVDGNVIRVMARYYGINDDIRSTRTKNDIQHLSDEAIDPAQPADFNQAVMELGATVCTPHQPDCAACPISGRCVAFSTVKTDSIPYKSPAKKVPHHQIGVGIIINDKNEVLIALRREDAMLGGLWEFPGGKKKESEKIEETVYRELAEELGVEVQVLNKFMEVKHAYSHFKITMHAYFCLINSGVPSPNDSQELAWVSVAGLEEYPFPKANKVLIEKLIQNGLPELS